MVNIPKLATAEGSNGKRKKRKASGVDYLDEEYRMLICGPSGRKPLVVYDQIYIYSPNHHQELIQDFQKIMHKLSQKVRYPILHLMNPDEILDTTEYPLRTEKLWCLMTSSQHRKRSRVRSSNTLLMDDITTFPPFISLSLITKHLQISD